MAEGQSYVRCQTLGPEGDWEVTLSPNGDRLAALTGAGTVRLIATDPWREVVQLGSPLGQLDAVAFSPDGTMLATLSAEMGEVTLWSAADGTFLRMFAGPPASAVDATVSSLVFSSDGGRLATSLGTVIDLASGASTGWLTGAPVTVALTVNPENLGFSTPAGGGIPVLRFTAGDALLFVETTYRVGNSPPSTRLALQDPNTGRQISLFDMYTRALLGFALSPDGRFVAVARTSEASVAGFSPGLYLFDATTGAQIASDPSFTGVVLAFSPDGARLYTHSEVTVSMLASTTLEPLGQFVWPADVDFLAVSPAGDLVGVEAGVTSWWEPASGIVIRSLPYPLAVVGWSGDGRFGAGTGDSAALFHLWREAGGAPLCSPAAPIGAAPLLAELGTPGPQVDGTALSADGQLQIESVFDVHTHATSYEALKVVTSVGGNLLRQFGAVPTLQLIAVSMPTGDLLYTQAGPDVAVWCR